MLKKTQKHVAFTTADLPLAVAKCGLESIVRRLSASPDAPCSAVALISDPEAVWIYEEAAVALMKRLGVLDPPGRFDVAILPDRKKGPGALISRMEECHSLILIAARREDITSEVEFMVDSVDTIPAPSMEDYVVAASELRLLGMTQEAASVLAGQRLHHVKLATRSAQPLQHILQRLRNASKTDVANTSLSHPEKRRLQDMVGYGEARLWGLQLAEDLAAWRKGEIEWSDVDRGVLLEGPPGCGKTSYGRALANTCGVELVAASGAQWQACGHLGDFLKAMQKSFEAATRQKPSILFLDEFDSFGSRDQPMDVENSDYRRQAINGLLERLDPPGGREGVVVIGATNNAAIIDPALLRPGRLEKVIKIGLPDADCRVAILRSYLGEAAEVGDLDRFVNSTDGWTGAQIEKLARDVRRLARRNGREVTEADISESLPTRIMLSPKQLHRLAVHEAGHAIVGVVLKVGELESVYITDHFMQGQSARIGEAVFRHPQPFMERPDHFSNSIAMLLAGIAAERLTFGNHSTGAGGGEGSDLVRATDLATIMERLFAFGGSLAADLGNGTRPLEALRLADPKLGKLVELRLQAELARASEILKGMRSRLGVLVSTLMRSYVVSGEEVQKILELGHMPGPTRRKPRPGNFKRVFGNMNSASPHKH